MHAMAAAATAQHLYAMGTVVFALSLRGLLIAGEAGLGAVGRERATELSEASRAGRAIARLKSDPELTAGGVRTALALCFTVAVVSAAGEAMILGLSAFSGLPAAIGWFVTAATVWLFTILVDVIPRSLAAAHPEAWALRIAPLLLGLRWLLTPMVRVVGGAVELLVRPLGAHVRFSLPPPPLDEIERMLTQSRQEGAPEPALVRSLFDFGERTVKEIMVPRTDVVAVPHDMPPEKIADFLVDQGHTRVPVYRGTLDTILGVLHIKDLLPLLANPELIILHDLLRPPPFVPWNRPIAKVMRELQRQHQHFAVVVDEYGGVAGIITLEDIVEQIVGDIRDEFDEEDTDVVDSTDGTHLVKAEMRVSEFNEAFGAQVPEEGGYETMGGFLSSLAGAIPSEGDRFFSGGLELQVTRRDPRRVLELRVTRVRSTQDDAPHAPLG
jgi:putative hemolysin